MTSRPRGTEETADLRLTGPAALLQAVPYLLGFHPSASLVLVGLDGPRLVVTARLDLIDLAGTTVLRDTFASITASGVTAVVGVVYEDSAPPPAKPVGADLPWSGLYAVLEEQAGASGCSVLDVLLVAGGRWWSYACSSPECCPPEGRPVEAATSEVSAAATYAGLVALPDRASLAATLDPGPDGERAALLPLIRRAEQAAAQAVADGTAGRRNRSLKRAIFAAARSCDGESARGGWRLNEPEVARFGAALRSVALRDAVWLAIDDGRLEGRELWQELARRLPEPYDAAPLFLLGWCAWRAGNGALASIAAARAVTSDPTYSAADLLRAALDRGLDPRRLPRLRLARPA